MLQNNVYRLGLLTHLQNEHVPLKVPECLRDLRTMYEAATIDDVNDAYAQFQMDDDHVFTCVGTSGEHLVASPAAIVEIPREVNVHLCDHSIATSARLLRSCTKPALHLFNIHWLVMPAELIASCL